MMQATITTKEFEVSGVIYQFQVYNGTANRYTAEFDDVGSTISLKVGDTGTLRLFVWNKNHSGVANISVDFHIRVESGITLSKTVETTNETGNITLFYTATRSGIYNVTAMPRIYKENLGVFNDTIMITVLSNQTQKLPIVTGDPTYIYVGVLIMAIVIVAVVVLYFIRKRLSKSSK